MYWGTGEVFKGKMDILFISHLYPNPNDLLYGQAIHQPAKRLHQNGHSISVFAPVPWVPPLWSIVNAKWKGYSEIPQENFVEGVRVFYPRYLALPRSLLQRQSGLSLGHSIRRCLVKKHHVSPKPDIIHAHSVFPDGYGAMKLSRRLNVPFCVSVRGTDIDVRAARSVYNAQFMKHVLDKADAVMAPSPRIGRQLRATFNVDPTVICNGFELNETLDELYFSKVSKLLKERKIVTSVSRLLETKGIDLNLKAIKELSARYPTILYIIAGEGPYRHQLEQLINELNIQESVIMLGHLNKSEVKAYLALSDVFSLPSSQETFGIAYLEAMSMSTPIVGCQGQGIDGIVQHGVSGFLVPPGDLGALVDVLDYLLSHKVESQKVAERGRQISLHYTWEHHVEKLVRLYESVIDKA